MLYRRGIGAGGTGAGDAAVSIIGGELCPTARGGEEGSTRGLKLCPPWVLAMLRLGKRRRWWRISATPAQHNTKNYKNVQSKMRKCDQS